MKLLVNALTEKNKKKTNSQFRLFSALSEPVFRE